MDNNTKIVGLLENIANRITKLEEEVRGVKESFKSETEKLAIILNKHFEDTNEKIDKVDFKTDEVIQKSFNQGYEIRKIKERLNI